jgi:hypothetical protein
MIHQIVTFGGGGYDFETVYRMPIWLRKFTYLQIVEQKQAEKEEINKVKNKSNSNQTKFNLGDKVPQQLKQTNNTYNTTMKK